MCARLSLILLLALCACASNTIGETSVVNTRPTVEDVMRGYPGETFAHGPPAILQCDVLEDGVLDNCRVLQQAPPGYAFAPPR